MRRQQGQFGPPYQLCTVPKSAFVRAHTHTHTCSLTHTAVARIQSVSSLSCRFVMVQKNGEWWCKAFKKPKKEEVITAKGGGLWYWYCWAWRLHSEWRSGFMGQDKIINLSRSETPVSPQRHWSRNIGLHPLTTTMPCFYSFTSCDRKAFHSGSSPLSYSYLLSSSAPRSATSLPSDKTTDTDLWQRETASENAEWGIDSDKAGVICGC